MKQGVDSAGETPRSRAASLLWLSSQAWNPLLRLLTAQGLGLSGTFQPPFLKSHLRGEDVHQQRPPGPALSDPLGWATDTVDSKSPDPENSTHPSVRFLGPRDPRPTFPQGLEKVKKQKIVKHL